MFFSLTVQVMFDHECQDCFFASQEIQTANWRSAKLRQQQEHVGHLDSDLIHESLLNNISVFNNCFVFKALEV